MNNLFWTVLLLAVLCLPGAWAGTPPQDPLIALAHAAPPEFAADALLRVAEGTNKLTAPAKIELIEEAFRLAQSAHFTMPYRSFRRESDSGAAVLNQAYRMHLDALSLQTRAVNDLLPLAPAKAREHFEEIRFPQLADFSCSDALVPDVSSFYEVLGSVIQTSFTPKERAKEEHVSFLLSYLSRLTSPVQLAPVAKLLPTLSLTPAQKDVVFVQFNGIMASMESPSRAYQATLPDIEGVLTDSMRPAFAEYEKRAGANTVQCHDSDIETHKFWQASESKAMFEKARNKQPDLVQELGSWSGPFEEKALIYMALLDTASGTDFDKTMAAFIQHLNGSNLQQQSPVEWFMPAKSLYERFHDGNSSQAERVMAAYRESGNPILVLYAAVEETYGSKRPSWIGVSTQ